MRIYIKPLLFSLVIFLLLFFSSTFAKDEIYQLRSNSLYNKLQIVLDVNKTPYFKAFALSNPIRVVVDVKADAAKNYHNNLTFKKRGVKLVRSAKHGKGMSRFVLDLDKNYYWEAYSLYTGKKNGNRIIIDIYDRSKGIKGPLLSNNKYKIKNNKDRVSEKISLESISNLSKNSPVINKNINNDNNNYINHKSKNHKSKNLNTSVVKYKFLLKDSIENKKIVLKNKDDNVKKELKVKNLLKETTEPSLKHRDIVIVIDPGHGGKDSGAIGKEYTKEKNVVLQIARRLKYRIDAIPGMTSILTRNDDKFITLRGRLKLARKYKADLFISIHADASPNRSAKGSSVYILSNRGATSESARWLAKNENSVDLKYGVDISDYDKDVGNVLLRIQQDATIETSNSISKSIISKMKRIGKLHKNNVERAGFVVLKSPDIPSILIETAFITNPDEEKRLNSKIYQEKLAKYISDGIQSYFSGHLPHYDLLGKQ